MKSSFVLGLVNLRFYLARVYYGYNDDYDYISCELPTRTQRHAVINAVDDNRPTSVCATCYLLQEGRCTLRVVSNCPPLKFMSHISDLVSDDAAFSRISTIGRNHTHPQENLFGTAYPRRTLRYLPVHSIVYLLPERFFKLSFVRASQGPHRSGGVSSAALHETFRTWIAFLLSRHAATARRRGETTSPLVASAHARRRLRLVDLRFFHHHHYFYFYSSFARRRHTITVRIHAYTRCTHRIEFRSTARRYVFFFTVSDRTAV